jgi:hypothetical protein
MIHRPYIHPPEGFIQGHRIWIPRHVMEMTRGDRKFWILEHDITDVHQPHWDGPGTNVSGFETLASMTVNGATTGPTATPGLSMLTRECMESVAPSYFKLAGSRFWIRAFGTCLSTAVITTEQITLRIGPTYANPLTGDLLAQHTALTPAAAVTGNWWLDAMFTVRATGAVGSLIGYGWLTNDLVTAGTIVQTPFRNANPPTAVALTTPGMLQSLFFDLLSIQGAATAGNSMVCLDYALVSAN